MPWWSVTLPVAVQLEKVSVTNRGDCCGEDLDGFSIFTDGVPCARGVSIGLGQTLHVPCLASGKEVRIVGASQRGFTLCELGIYASAAGLPFHSNDYHDAMQAALKAPIGHG